MNITCVSAHENVYMYMFIANVAENLMGRRQNVTAKTRVVSRLHVNLTTQSSDTEWLTKRHYIFLSSPLYYQASCDVEAKRCGLFFVAATYARFANR